MDEETRADIVGTAGIAGARITIVVSALGAGGTEHVVSLVASHWAGLGCIVTVITLEAPTSQPYYDLDPRVSLERLDLPTQKASKLRAALLVARRLHRLRSVIRRTRPDFVLSFLTRTNVLTLLATRGLPIPVIVSERNNPAVQPFGPFWKWLQLRLYPRAFALVTMTTGALDHFPPAVRRSGRVIANAVNLPAVWQKRRGNNVLTAVGRLTSQKGFDLLLEAFAKVAPEHPEWKLVIWGEGEARKELEAQRDTLGLNDRVEMPGVTARPGIWVETADAFVLSSRYEGWGIALLEAMASGVPVVSFACEWGPTDMIDHGEDGILVPNGDIDALADALSNLMGDSALRTRLAANAEASVRRYDAEHILSQWDAVAVAALEHAGARKTAVKPKVVPVSG
ncbi:MULTISPECIES: glycosyltransferase family 4 protein [unclassified Ensifer]|uniref:glycosyltransferase family 4 protein n=1 Tax=unclassified Ensifer TaxID=2633371 RepID=UPI000813B50D|nr:MULTISPECIES: glycosyltransferase family 4 protein [unclassified Ensifer]OCP09267.1 amylovoran biosynthesis protein AmsD [Ensifer sp. LC13]OCP10449.1 amylovoran biosynthesis protein AmsD [Ensifer sp. LC11]OCP13945.1 amylovoran biosynthesis protein AmsD [Ensifer sp. LC14]OCP32515.1 amylovoran biosynthesis protein AmsD [Ensifer sp. LC499]